MEQGAVNDGEPGTGNIVSGTVHGPAVQAHTIEGDVSATHVEHIHQTAVGAFSAQASMGSTAIAAHQLIVVLGSELPEDDRADLLRQLANAVSDLSRTVVIDRTGNLIGEGARYVPIENNSLRAALASIATAGPPVPQQLPIDVVDFTDRDVEMGNLDDLVRDRPGTVCLHGMGGVGKSSIVTHFAHTRQQFFPDGILWGDLRYQQTDAILDMFAYSYGVDLSSVTDLRAKSSVVKSLLDQKRALIVLDNAEAATQLELLINIGGSASIIVTTREADTPQLRGETHISIDTFDATIALEHLARVLGYQLSIEEKQSAQNLAASLGYLPLALDIGIRLAKRAHLALDTFADLINEASPSVLLVDGNRSLAKCFNISWDALQSVHRKALLSMTVLNAASFEITALAAINERHPGLLQTFLGDLVASSLVTFTHSGRYLLHPLVRDFVSGQLTNRGPEVFEMGNRAAVHYLKIVETEAAKPETDVFRWATVRQELDNLVAAWRWASANTQHKLVVRFADSLGKYLFDRGYWETCTQLFTEGISEAAHLHDVDSEMSLRLRRAEVARELGVYDLATEDLDICTAETEHRVDDLFKARVVRELGELRRVQRDYQEALRLHRLSLDLSTSCRDPRGMARSFHDCGLVERIIGNFERARECFLASIEVSHQLNIAAQEAYSKFELGIVSRTTGDYDVASDLISDALRFFAACYDLRGQSYAHRELGELAIERHDYEEAAAQHGESLRLRKTLRDRRGEAISSYYLGYAYQCLGRAEAADELYMAALPVSEELHDLRNVARLRLRIGELNFELGEAATAIDCWKTAVQLFDALGVVEEEANIARKHLREAL